MEEQEQGQASGATIAAAATATAAPPTPLEKNAAGEAITAPASTPAREAFDRLARGERPEEVNRELYQKPAESKAPHLPTQATPAKQDATPTTPAQQQEQDAGQPQPGQWPEGLPPKDLNVLKRAQLDAETWKAIPPSNQVKILKNLRESQAAADREFQQRKAAGQQARTPAATANREGQGGAASAADTTQETDETAQDEAARQDLEQQRQEEAPAQQQQRATQPAQQQQAALNPDSLVDPADLETLRAIGGDELATVHQRGVRRAVEAVQQQMAPIMGIAEFLFQQHIDGQFKAAFDELKETPGLENLTPEQTTALRSKAELLIKAAGDPRSYGFAEATRDAAASLFKTNVHQTAQARLLGQRRQSLATSPDRGRGNRLPADRALEGKDRMKAIFNELASGRSPEEARAVVDGR